ncbi:LysR family transcriptional regulator [Oscillospiraceae bacterium WX1]
MRYYNIRNLSFNQIEIFLTAAEYGSFNAAAQKLNYSQSMISKSIACLESDLGLILFLRNKTNNALTPAGRLLYQDWKHIYSDVEASLEKAHIAQTGLSSSISVGSVDTMIYSSGIVEVIRNFRQRYPFVSLHYEEDNMGVLIEKSKKRTYDIIFTARHDVVTLEKSGYLWKDYIKSYISIFVHRSNPLYYRDKLTISDLAAEEFIVLSPSSNPNYMDLLIALCRLNGFTPKISTYISNAHAFVMNLLEGRGVVLADNYTKIEHNEIKMFVLNDIPAGIVVSWPEKTTNINIKNFLAIVDEISEELSTETEK